MNKNLRNIIIAVFVTCIVNCAAFMIVLHFNNNPLGSASVKSEDSQFLSKVSEIDKIINKYAIMPFDKEQALENALYFYAYSMEDKYTTYMDTNEYKDHLEQLEGSFTGIGINVITENETLEEGLLVYRVIGNSPAEAAGLKNGDIIIEANGVSFKNYEYADAIDILLDEAGTAVNIVVDRGGENLEFNIVRQNFMQRLVDYDIIGEVGYVIIYQFEAATLNQFYDAMVYLEESGVKGYIFDVRNNPGGELNTIKNVIDLLVPKDEIVILQYKDYESTLYSTDKRLTTKPSVVLMNGSTASAAELFSSALRDIIGSALIGEKSYGKGVGQTTFALSDGSAYKVTTFRFLTKSRTDFNGIGLEPDYTVEGTEDMRLGYYTITRDMDPQLQKAIQVIGEIVSENR